MNPFNKWRDGYYDDKGVWQRTKFCFVYCGEHCTCGPPNGQWYDENTIDEFKEKSEDKKEGP